MPTLATMLAFSAAVALFAAVPGPSNLYVVAQSLGAGRRAGYLAALGCAAGASMYVAAAAMGLAAVLASSQWALAVLHYAGGLYLLYLAWTTWRSASTTPPPAARRGGRYLTNGFLVELANPKVALFFVAFLPQFLSPERGALWSQVAVLGLLFAIIGLASDSAWALVTGLVRDRVTSRGTWLRRSRRASSVVYAALGSWALISGSRAVRS